MNATWMDLLGAALGGGMVVKVLDFAYQEYVRRSAATATAKDVVEKHLDPILKAADELVGKIRSLAQSDCRELTASPLPPTPDFTTWSRHLDLLYLFAQFWARIQVLRIESLYVGLGLDKRGKRLLDFIQTLEGTRTRLVDRGWQRGIGETLLDHRGSGPRAITYVEFVERFLTVAEFRRWYEPVVTLVLRLQNTKERQRLFVYGVVLHAMINTLDEKHAVTRDRPGWGNKLSERTRRDLKFRVFRVYLPFVPRVCQYLDPTTGSD